jgi:ribosomal protein S18 acetylase RimI-like enzyme
VTADQGDITLHDARPADRERIRELTLAAYAEYAGIMAPTAWAGLHGAVVSALASDEPSIEWIVAKSAGEIVGSVMLYPPKVAAYGGEVEGVPWPELRLLAVDAAFRGRGVGQRLVEECVHRARAMGADELGLHTSRSMEAAIRMYRKMGFERAPAHDFHPEGAELVQAFRLPFR